MKVLLQTEHENLLKVVANHFIETHETFTAVVYIVRSHKITIKTIPFQTSTYHLLCMHRGSSHSADSHSAVLDTVQFGFIK